MNRKSVGIIALLLLGLGVLVAWRGPEDGSAAGLASGCIRVGLVMGALWLAFPQIIALVKRTPGWLLSWFMKSSKSAGKAPPEGSPRPPVRVRRPRRRSNS